MGGAYSNRSVLGEHDWASKRANRGNAKSDA